MMPPEPEHQSMNAVDLLREEVSLLREIKVLLAGFAESQSQLQQSMTNLVRINAVKANDGTDVFVQNINMPFFAMVGLMIKWSIASIPAGIILLILGGMVFFGISVLCGGTAGLLGLLSGTNP